jgi:hypothetical protein
VKADQPTEEGYSAAAWLLMIETRVMKAIAIVEAGPEGAFLPTGEPVILFEPHVFHRLTGGKYDAAHPDLSSPLWDPKAYGPYSAQHPKLQRAVELDRDAALKSCSWGLFQIMGENHARAGYPALQRFITAMYRSADDHLRALVMFLRNDWRLVDAMRAREWDRFAYVYNGPGYARGRYDSRMAEAYQQLA